MPVVMVDILVHHQLQVATPEDQHPVKQLAPHRWHCCPPLFKGYTVLPVGYLREYTSTQLRRAPELASRLAESV